MNWAWRFVFLFVALLLLDGAWVTRSQVLYEQFLNSLYINWPDLPADYSEALKASVANNAQLQYDHSTFPSTTDDASKIPPIVHFIWFKNLYEVHPDGTEIPSIGSHAPKMCEQYNPDFTINIWNSSAARTFMEENYAWFLPTFDGYKYPIQRVDAFKYFVLWHYGGVYMDLDIACRRPLAPLLQFPAWFPRAQPLGVNNDLMASRPKHPIIGKMTETLKPRDKNLIFPYLTIFWTTGPRFTTDVLRMWFEENGNKYEKGAPKIDQDEDLFYVLPIKFYSEKYTFFGHSPGGTWHGEDVAVVLWLVDRPWIGLIVGAGAILACLFFAVRRRKFKYDRIRKAQIGD